MWLCDSWVHPGQVARSYYFWFLKYNVLFQNKFFSSKYEYSFKEQQILFCYKKLLFWKVTKSWLTLWSELMLRECFFTSLLSSAFLKTVSTDSRLHTRVVHSRTSAHLKHISALPCPLSLIRFSFFFLAIWLVMGFGLILFAPDCRCTFITYLSPSLPPSLRMIREEVVWCMEPRTCLFQRMQTHNSSTLRHSPVYYILRRLTISLSPTVDYCLCAANFLSLSVSLGWMTLCAICLFISTTSS